MNSEKVKEIKAKLQEEIFIATKFDDKLRRVETKDLQDILTLINELESKNERLRNAKVVYETVDYCAEDLRKAEKRIAELEKENGELKQHITEVEKGIINIARERNKKEELASKFIDSYNDSLKQFAERLKESGEIKALLEMEIMPKVFKHIHNEIVERIDETLKEFING